MSAVSVAPSTQLPAATKVPFGRLVLVEWRKMTDTRAGRTLLIISAAFLLLVMAGVVLVAALNDNFQVNLSLWSQILVFPLSLLTPVLAILIVTQEWGQRTHMVTFTLEPSRLRVIVAKLVAVIALVLALMLVAVLCGVVGNVLAAGLGGYQASWSINGATFAWTVVTQLLYFVMAFGLAMCLLSTPFSIVVVYTVQLILPIMVWTPLMAFFGWARDLLPFLDMNLAASPFIAQSAGGGADLGASDYFAMITSLLLWVVAPLVFGSMRVIKSELK